MYKLLCEHTFFISLEADCWINGYSVFSHLWKCHIIFPKGYTDLYSRYHCSKSYNLSTTFLYLIFFLFDYSHPATCEVVLNCISLMINDVGHLFSAY